MDKKRVVENYTWNKTSLLDLQLYNVGIEECEPKHSYGPSVRSTFLIHYILNGRGVFEVDKKRYSLAKGQAFLIFPEIITYYEADEHEPWFYIWLQFGGIRAKDIIDMAGFTQANPVFIPADKTDQNPADHLLKIMDNPSLEFNSVGLAYLFFSELINNSLTRIDERARNKSKYIEMALNYISVNYWKPIKIQELAELCNLDRSYFCRLFKNKIGSSPQDYILKYKVNAACELLKRPELSIGEVSRSVGYNDQMLFSKIFKKITGEPPSSFKSRFV